MNARQMRAFLTRVVLVTLFVLYIAQSPSWVHSGLKNLWSATNQRDKCSTSDLNSNDTAENNLRNSKTAKFAYVFYASDVVYLCYAFINIDRLVNRLRIRSDIDLVILLPPNSKALDAKKLSVFGLYTKYTRVIFLDSDGIVVRNMDHLFTMEFDGHEAAGVWAFGSKKSQLPNHLTSAFFVADLSEGLYNRVKELCQPSMRDKILQTFKSRGKLSAHVYDMEIINYLWDKGNRTFLLPPFYARLDFYFETPDHDPEIAYTFYIHFSAQKPFIRYRANKPKTLVLKQLMAEFWPTAQKFCPDKVALQKLMS